MTLLPNAGTMAAVSAAVPSLAAAGAQLLLTPRRARLARAALKENEEMTERVAELRVELEEQVSARAEQEERQEAVAHLQLEATRAEAQLQLETTRSEAWQRAEEFRAELTEIQAQVEAGKEDIPYFPWDYLMGPPPSSRKRMASQIMLHSTRS